ncbi:hydrogenobyrinic acid a,c-diamide synthase (glutamine-hydrolysing) /cobyrinate a,c-diamide synthase [Salsuginibacillus halophilus]|uniref:Cobyrinate a,c-diamide synthase n=1 Tax=Salsuginibacillus halophilus TaxID=517424 RepID=A0A2P8HL19_9BACI|nr:cobyrinate a,c-diamide synthase [Salsuginibacillus halophilus]PSL46911.1 hydrogenobyrinic acid a,c-diamide synthase (glutamine-hydrolysing) /cobyrinate a,c-diamide synthase [Salsuginibacillus halophilus]
MWARLVIAGTGSGAGKTTAAVGLMAAFKQAGFKVQGFKCGPDYIDPSYYQAVTERPARNLDSWMMTTDVMNEVLRRGSRGADISIIEGVMGFFDGKSPTSDEGSTADISRKTKSPVLLVIDAGGVARSAAAMVKGFQAMAPDINICGVVANQVGSTRHFELIQEAVSQECGIPVVGYLTKNEELKMPERHLGLVPSVERGDLNSFFAKLGDQAAEGLELEHIQKLAEAPPVPGECPSIFKPAPPRNLRIAVARDAAFNFYYEENFELLEAFGAEVVTFSPLADEAVPPETDGLYFGGGFPEVFAETLSENDVSRASIQTSIQYGMPVLAECGGFMYLCRSLTTLEGQTYPMLDVIPGHTRMHDRLQAIGYRNVTFNHPFFSDEIEAKGHEFHYSSFTPAREIEPAFYTSGMSGEQAEGCARGSVTAGYTHLHFASSPAFVESWLNACERVKLNAES